MTIKLYAYMILWLSMIMLTDWPMATPSAYAFMLGASSLLCLLLRRGDPALRSVRAIRPRGKSRR